MKFYYKAKIYQELRLVYECSDAADSEVKEFEIKLWLAWHIKHQYDLFLLRQITGTKLNLKTPIKINLLVNDKLKEFVCKPVSKFYLTIQLKESDVLLLLKQTKFIILPFRKGNFENKTNYKTNNLIEVRDLEPILNTIEYQLVKKYKRFGPIIYIGHPRS